MKVITTLAVAILLTGCATGEYAQYSKAQTDIAVARHTAEAAKYKAMSEIAASGDSAAKVAAVMALALGAGNNGQATQIAAPQPNQALQWASILVPGITQVAGMRYNYLSQQTASNNATALGLSTNNAFVGLAGKIQAPGTVTTNTLSGVGNLGGGAYSTTDRNDVTTPAPVVVVPVTPIVPVTPTVPVVITPVVNTTPAPVVP